MLRCTIALVALSLAASSPALAGSHATRSGYDARAEAVGSTVISGRASAIEDCNKKTNAQKEYTWGNQTDQEYRACMAQRGQGE
jgi:hypothetical protein